MNHEQHENLAWSLLTAARALADRFPEVDAAESFGCSVCGQRVESVSGLKEGADLSYCPQAGWRYRRQLPSLTQHMLDLYLPVLGSVAQPTMVIAHLGQSIDARIATTTGDAFFVTGEENRKHLHRLRSLCQAVVVGAGTVIIDNPQLTVRAVVGDNPVRVILDPQARVPAGLTVLNDGQAPTWLLHSDSVRLEGLPALARGRRLTVSVSERQFEPDEVLKVLASQGLRRVFVEGGGTTVSRFFKANCLHRLQIATAPVLVGDGVPALQLPGAASMQAALRPDFGLYRMGQDVLWDFTLANSRAETDTDNIDTLSALQRLL